MKKLIVIVLLFFMYQGAIAQSELLKKLDEKNGFKDLTFGMSFNECKAFLEATPIKNLPDEKTAIYKVKVSDEFYKVSKYSIKNIETHFFDNKLYMIRIYLDGAYNSRGFLDVLERAYGKGNQETATKERYIWIGQKVLMSYDERSYSEDTEVVMESESLGKERKIFIESYGIDDL